MVIKMDAMVIAMLEPSRTHDVQRTGEPMKYLDIGSLTMHQLLIRPATTVNVDQTSIVMPITRHGMLAAG